MGSDANCGSVTSMLTPTTRAGQLRVARGHSRVPGAYQACLGRRVKRAPEAGAVDDLGPSAQYRYPILQRNAALALEESPEARSVASQRRSEIRQWGDIVSVVAWIPQ